MPGRILIIDAIVTNRIVLKVKLMAAQYSVIACGDPEAAERAMRSEMPDLILVDIPADSQRALEFCRAVRARTGTSNLPLIGMCAPLRPEDRIKAFKAGLDDLMVKPLHDSLLLARIRSLMRDADAGAELRLREGTRRALGLAEAGSPFDMPPRIALITDNLVTGLPLARDLSHEIGVDVPAIDSDVALTGGSIGAAPDLFLIDGRDNLSGEAEGRLFRLVADLRSRRESRLASQMVLLPAKSVEFGAMALDLGANDTVQHDAALAEIAVRIRGLIARKRKQDQLRATVRTGLEAAITDPLTGLYNRRYALPHLAAIAEQSLQTGKEFAVLAIDIDHFKMINDSFGHAVGDRALCALADQLRQGLRPVDLIARVGGEEFLVMIPDTSMSQAIATAQRIRQDVEKAPLVYADKGGPVRITLSIGVAFGSRASPGDTPEQVLEHADSALYAAKATGRNRVEINPGRAA